MNENELLQKLVVAKQIMNKHNEKPRGNGGLSNTSLQDFDAVPASYNLPTEFLQEEQSQVKTTRNTGQITKERILNSKLPEEIKQLMIENPIVQPETMSGPTLSDDLINKANRLMRENVLSGDNTPAKAQPQGQTQRQSVSENTDIKKMVKEAVREILSESGLLVESTSKSNDAFSFRVGQHIFEGKISKIKKLK
jgi:hypothetical protein